MKHLRELVTFARELGVLDARVEQRRRHPHLVGTKPDGTALRYPLPASPSDSRRGQRNAEADLRRACRPEAGAGNAPATQRSALEGSRTTKKPGRHPGAGKVARARTRRPQPRAAARQADGASDSRRGNAAGPASPFDVPALHALRQRLVQQQGTAP